MAGKFRIGITRDAVTANGTLFGEEAFEALKDPAAKQEAALQAIYEKSIEDLEQDWRLYVAKCY